MATNKVSGEGLTWKYTTTGNVSSGDLLLIGSTAAVAMETAVTGVEIAVVTGGEWILPKKAAASTNMAVGGRAYVMTTGSTNKVTGVAAAGKLIGWATKAAVTGATTAQIALMQAPAPLETQT